MEKDKRLDRLAMRARPSGHPIMHQTWQNLLFLHWPISPDQLRPLIPPSLEIDTHEGQAWVGITPFHLRDSWPEVIPAEIPGFSPFHELNVRTYVLGNHQPGIYFFSLDASKLMPVVAGRAFFMLPYFKSRIRFGQTDTEFLFTVNRTGPPPATFRAAWRIGQKLRDPDVESLAFFLVERYCAYVVEGGETYQIRIYHHPWILEEAMVDVVESTMLGALGLSEPMGEPLAHFGRSMDVRIWAPLRVGTPAKSKIIQIPIGGG